jgi:hypothetical protein
MSENNILNNERFDFATKKPDLLKRRTKTHKDTDNFLSRSMTG